ncbi:MAG: lysylphosphatidylglycerol synthase transmembrane domain-containing protein, partial [Acidimicrobiales bacterium]
MTTAGDGIVGADPEGEPVASKREPVPSKGSSWRRLIMSPWFRYGLGIALGALALWAVAGQRGELNDATIELSHLNVGWLLLAVASEAMSVVAFAQMQGRLLRSGGVAIPRPRLIGMTAAAGAIASSIPAGPAVSSLFAYRQYRRHGADEALAGWSLAATLVTSALGLTTLATAGLALAQRQGAAFDLIGVTLGVFVVTVVATAVLWQRRALAKVGLSILRGCRKVTGRPHRHEAEVIAGVMSRLGRVQLSWYDFLRALAWSVANWSLDCGALACGYLAVHAAIPWQALLLAYGAGQLASNLPITPGGLGVVEGSLTVALVAYGGAQASTVGAVLLYRIVSFWGFLPVGWLAWL